MFSIILVAEEKFHGLILVSLGLINLFFLLEVFNVLSLFLELKILCRTVGPLSFILIGTW